MQPSEYKFGITRLECERCRKLTDLLKQKNLLYSLLRPLDILDVFNVIASETWKSSNGGYQVE